MAESFFAELKRYVRFGADDETALRAMLPQARPQFRRIAEEFYLRLSEHPEAVRVFSGPEQVERLKGTLCDWMELLLSGPWDEAYYEKRARIGRMHVKIALPQRYMFSAMNLIRVALQDLVGDHAQARLAVAKIIDLELAIMLETYREAFVVKVQALERHERELLEDRLALSEARYGEIVEKAASLVTTFDDAGTILLFNRRCEELTGLDRSQAIGHDWVEIFFAEEARAEVRERVAEAKQRSQVTPFEGTARVAGGAERRVRWHLTTLPSGGEPVLCALGVDVTEERALETRTRRAERLAALGTMAAGLAHELRNPLNAAHLQLAVMQRRLARKDGADVDGARQAADLVGSEMRRLAALVQEFLQFARPQPLKIERVDLRTIAVEVAAAFSPAASEQSLTLRVDDGAPVAAEADGDRLRQVLQNLVRNAIEAGGNVVVRVSHEHGVATLEVADDGPGLPSPEAPIFEPFFTTKAQGTGLGLSIVHRIVADHGGKISVESHPGRTVFTVSLPG